MPSPVAAVSSPTPSATPAAGAVLRRLPGKAEPREDAWRAYQELNSQRRKLIPAVLWQFWAPDPDVYYRWRVQLDCGCITEVMTWGDKDLPAEGRWPDPVSGTRLPAGQVLCRHDDSPPAPYRDIAEWGERREVSFPADPAEPPDWADSETWVVLRHDEPRISAFWKVTLSCGHVTDVVSELAWKPADGPSRVSARRQREMTADFEEFWVSDPNRQSDREREHTKRMLTAGWPIPAPEHLCYACTEARVIVAYQRTGWLVPRKPEPKLPKPPSRASLERRLRHAEADAAQLRSQLAQLDT
jgi:hypothetical protein